MTHIHHSSRLNILDSKDWLEPAGLRLEGDKAQEWNSFLLRLRSSGISLSDEVDTLVWTLNHSIGSVTVQSTYEALVAQNLSLDLVWWYLSLWKFQASVKQILFVWL